MSNLLKTELGWFVLALLAGLVCGLIVGAPLLVMLLFSCVYTTWLLIRMGNIVKWLESGAAPSKAPPTTGMMNHVVGIIHREKAYSRKQKNRYRTSLARFNSLAAELPDATVVFDGYRCIQWSNAASLSLLNIHPERDRDQRIDNLLRAPDMLEFLGDSEQGNEVEIQSPAAPEKTLSMIKVKTGKGMTVLIARDVTQRVKLREMRKAFVADVSHELRTPLTVMRGYLEMLVEDDRLDQDIRKNLKNVQTQSDRMQYIVSHLLELSKLEGNPLGETEGQEILVAAQIQSIATTLIETTGSQHRLEINADENLNIIGSESEIYSATSNLISNAINYTNEGTRISVTWKLNEAGLPQLSVIDDGQGIEHQHISRLSERFYRVDKSRSRETGGTGLGLAIVKHVAQRHGGQLLIDSTPGLGSQFHIEFPASRIARSQTASNL